MISKKSSIILAAVVTLLSFVTITWLSCNKPGKPYSCDGVICANGGVCTQDTTAPHKPYCLCPTGFEGATCGNAIVTKYLGTWNVKQYVQTSDSIGYAGTTSYYTMLLNKTATNTTFFMNNFYNNANYNEILCKVDSSKTTTFVIDTTSNAHMFFNNFKIISGSGTIYANDSIVFNISVTFVNGTANRQRDVFHVTLTPHS